MVNRYNYLLACYGEDGKRLAKAPEGSYGTFDARIVDLAISGADSGADLISSGEECQIRLTLEAGCDLEAVTVGILIRDRFGQDIYGTNTDCMGIPLSLKAGERRLVMFSFPLQLQTGKYSLTAALHTDRVHNHTCYHWLDNALSFEVAGLRGTHFSGITNLQARFCISPEEEAS